MKTPENLPVATCVANLETKIHEAAQAGPLKVGPFAIWEGGERETIEIVGQIKLKGFFADRGIRWLCPSRGSRGLFGKGYVEIRREMGTNADGLPKVK